MNHIFASVISLPMTPTTKKHVKNVHCRVAMHISSSSLQAIFPMFIIDLPLLFIREYLIGLSYLFELNVFVTRQV